MAVVLPIIVQQQQEGAQRPSSGATTAEGYSVQVAWSPVFSFAFRLGISELGGDDVLTSPFSTDWDGTYDELVGQADHGVKSVRIRRGRDDVLSEMAAGEATIVLHDPDGRFNPANASSPLAGQLIPMRPVRVRALWESEYQPLFRGFVRSIQHDPARGAQETVIECIDLFVWLSRVNPVITSQGGTTTGAAINRVLASIGFTDPALISLDDGDEIPDFSADGTTSALALIEGLLEVERGVFFVSAGGVATYRNRHARSLRAVDGTLSDSMTGALPGVSLDLVANRARVTKTDGTEQEAVDGTSAATYGTSDAASIESPYLRSDSHALSLAQFIVGQRAQPRAPMWGVGLMNADVATTDQIMRRDLGDRLTVSENRGGTSGDYIIEALAHDISDGGKFHRASMTLSERGVGEVFVLGSSTLGGGDILTYL